MIIKKEEFISLLDKFLARSENWMKGAGDREDLYDVFYYKGQRDLIKELKNMAENWK